MFPYDTRYVDFFSLFNKQEYFEAHELLESLWRDTSDERKDFYQGLIQLAACLLHRKNGNREGSEKLIQTASGYLGRYPSPYQGLDINRAVSLVKACALESERYPKLYLK